MEYIPNSNALDSPAEFSGGSFTPQGTPPPLAGGSFTPQGTPPPLASGSFTPQGTPPPLAAGSFTPPGTPPPVPDVSFTPPGTPPPPPSNPVPIPTPEVIEISDDDDEPMERDPVEESWRQLSDLIENCEERIRAAVRTLAPQDGETMLGFFRKMMEAFLELSENTQRDKLNAQEHSYLLQDFPQIQLILRATEESNVQLLTALINRWMSLINSLSNACRSQRVQELLATMKNPPARSARRSPLECPICTENLSNNRRSNVRAPCHPTHVFHRNCLQEWLQEQLNCPMCRAQYALPRRRQQRRPETLGRRDKTYQFFISLCIGL